MGGFVIKLIAFFFLFILSNIVYLIFIQNIDWNYSKRLEALNFNSPNYDVLVLGNSLAMDGIDAEELSKNGFNAYNLALGGSSLMTNYIQ